MGDKIFGLDSQLLVDTGITLIAMLVLFILLSYLLFNPARKLIQKRKDFIQGQLEKASEEAHQIKVRAEKEVELEKNKVRDEMKQEMVQVASAMAGKFVEASMNKDKQAQLIDETLKEMGDETWQS